MFATVYNTSLVEVGLLSSNRRGKTCLTTSCVEPIMDLEVFVRFCNLQGVVLGSSRNSIESLGFRSYEATSMTILPTSSLMAAKQKTPHVVA